MARTIAPIGGTSSGVDRTLDLSSIELFAGGGGMALGMKRAGFRHLALAEWWKPAALVLRHNASEATWEQDRVIEKDVREVLPQLTDMGPVTLIAGGPPCQPFSLAGASAGHADERNMFPAALDLVRRLLPPFVVFENVPGLLRTSFAPYLEYVQDQMRRPDIEPSSADELWSDHHSRILRSHGDDIYHVFRDQIDAADIGVAQNRKRVFLIGIRTDLVDRSDWPGVRRTHSRVALLRDQWVTGEYWLRHGLKAPAEPPKFALASLRRIASGGENTELLPWRTLRDLLADVPTPDEKHSPPGWPNHIAIPGARVYPNHTGSPLDFPSKTIKAGVHGVAGGEAMIRRLDGSVRYLTIREAALAQGFPRQYEFPTSRSRMMGVIGNAVAVDVAASIGEALIATLKSGTLKDSQERAGEPRVVEECAVTKAPAKALLA
jgi:DNA (cytosine-5)-methyltransferase 1